MLQKFVTLYDHRSNIFSLPYSANKGLVSAKNSSIREDLTDTLTSTRVT